MWISATKRMTVLLGYLVYVISPQLLPNVHNDLNKNVVIRKGIHYLIAM